MPPLSASARCSLLAALVRAHVAEQTGVAREMLAAGSGRAVSLPAKIDYYTGLAEHIRNGGKPDDNVK